MLQVGLDSEAEEQVVESAGCHGDNKAVMGCESDSVSVADRVSQNVDLYSLANKTFKTKYHDHTILGVSFLLSVFCLGSY